MTTPHAALEVALEVKTGGAPGREEKTPQEKMERREETTPQEQMERGETQPLLAKQNSNNTGKDVYLAKVRSKKCMFSSATTSMFGCRASVT
jgi:hypothetical protein